MREPLYRHIAQILQAYQNCIESDNSEWATRHAERICKVVKEFMPSGSGVDNGTKLDESSTPQRLLFTFGYHHINEGGVYDGWTHHTCIVTPCLALGFNLRITGRNRYDIKTYLHDLFRDALASTMHEGP